jgi:hypothetical protein
MSAKPEWYDFQETICNHFLSIGARAETNVSIQGTRTTHAIDILVRIKYLGQDMLWIVEAKKWNSKINKLQVLGLRTIINDIGADKGFIISQKGFQSGAIEAAQNSNIKLSTFNQLIDETKEFVQSEIIQNYEKRLILLETRYWSHEKKIRVKYGLRGEVWDYPVIFSGNILLLTAHWVVKAAKMKIYPIDLETYMVEKKGILTANNFNELTNWLNLNLNFLDEKILKAEMEMIRNGDFNPDLYPRDELDLPIYITANLAPRYVPKGNPKA